MKYISIFIMLFLLGCKKEEVVNCENPPTDISQSMVFGQVWAYQLNGSLTDTIAEYPSQDTYVYIVGDNSVGFDSSTKTEPDGYYRFDNLEPGYYTVYVYSFDIISINGTTAITKEVHIQNKNETIQLERINILNQP